MLVHESNVSKLKLKFSIQCCKAHTCITSDFINVTNAGKLVILLKRATYCYLAIHIEKTKNVYYIYSYSSLCEACKLSDINLTLYLQHNHLGVTTAIKPTVMKKTLNSSKASGNDCILTVAHARLYQSILHKINYELSSFTPTDDIYTTWYHEMNEHCRMWI